MQNIQYYEKLAISYKNDCEFGKYLQAAEKVYRLANDQQKPIAAKNLAYAYNSNNFPEKALEINNTLEQNCFDVLFQRAQILYTLNEKQESYKLLEHIQHTFELTNEQQYLLWSAKSQNYLQDGNIAQGIDRFLNTKKPKVTELSMKNIPKWQGIPQPGYTLYVNANGGYGDEFINIRFFHHVKKLGMTPVLYDGIKRFDIDEIFCYNGYQVITNPDKIPNSKYNLWCDLMSLPVLLNVTENKLWNGPYLNKVPNQYPLDSTKKRKIGIKSQGNKKFASNPHRPIDLEQLVFSIPTEYEIYVLDLDLSHPRANNIGNKISNWKQTLDILSQLDAVLTSCTSIAHASGALGVPTITCVPISEYYVWTSTRTDTTSPWYDYENYVVLKQQKPRCWKKPLEQANKILTQWINHE